MRQYAKPPALDNFNQQGTFSFTPHIILLEDNSLAGLQSQLQAEVDANTADPRIYFVIKDVQYQVVYKPPSAIYSLMLHVETAVNA